LQKFKNKYRIPSNRRPNWDYSQDALYFLTVVTQNRVCNLGKIDINQSDEMILSEFGKIVDIEWHKSFEIRDELLLHAFILMPNHFHAIVEIRNENPDFSNDMGKIATGGEISIDGDIGIDGENEIDGNIPIDGIDAIIGIVQTHGVRLCRRWHCQIQYQMII
jgi:hypothetical protein